MSHAARTTETVNTATDIRTDRRSPRCAPCGCYASGRTILSLFDYSGNWSRPYLEAGANVQELNDEIERLKRAALPRIKELVARAAQREAELRALLQTVPDLFEKPRTVTFHGIKVGFRKGSGGIDWEDDAQVCKLIRKHFPDDAAACLIKTTERPIAKALAELDVATLKKLGCTVEDTGDVVVIKATDSEIEKAVNALLASASEE